MTNRRDRGRSVRRDLAELFADQLAACPDCASDAEMVEQYPGVFVLSIAHDNTCPKLRAMRGQR